MHEYTSAKQTGDIYEEHVIGFIIPNGKPVSLEVRIFNLNENTNCHSREFDQRELLTRNLE